MRLLHTADWHLGCTLAHATRAAEHEAFLDWLLGALEEHRCDALLVAGDIFDQNQPTAAAQEAYYRFLARATSITSLRRIVVVGGNHDSATRLDAPEGVLRALDVAVVGGYSASADISRYLVPIAANDGHVHVVVVALPYVHGWKLGIDDQASPGALAEAFKRLYSDLADAALERWPDVALVATGHLTCAREPNLVAGHAADDDHVGTLDAPQEIHMVGTLGALPPTIFDERYRYVALGHIHKGYPVDRGRVWYSGTPVAVNFAEGASARKVLLVDLEEGALRNVQPIVVPATRRVVEFRGDEASLRTALSTLAGDEPEPPLVSMILESPEVVLGQRDAIQAHLDSLYPDRSRRPVMAAWREIRTARGGTPPPPPPPMERPTPEMVFRRAWIERHHSPPDDGIMAAFASLVSNEIP
jgi:exonuclease SbcD